MADFSVVFDPMLDKERAEFDNGSGGSGGSSYVGGERINIAGGTISFVNSADIVNVTGTSVTLQPDTAYKIYATSQAITLNANPPAAGKWAYEGHLEIFTAGTGYVVTGTNVVLANALEPDSVNNCTVRFHDGIAIIAVEDHVAGYIVVNGATSGSGSLAYGIATSTNDYVAFDASLNGTTIPLAGAVAEGEKHVVGNGYTETAITGAVNCGTSKFTVANLSLDDVQVTGGTLTLGDAYIPSGSTVAVSGGGLAVEKVTGNGGVVDLGGTEIGIFYGASASISSVTVVGATTGAINVGGDNNYGNVALNGCTFTSNSADYGAAISQKNSASVLYASQCVFSSNHADVAAAVRIWGGSGTFTGCEWHDNTAYPNLANAISLANGATVELTGCTFGAGQSVGYQNSASLALNGVNTIYLVSGTSGTVTIASGAILDLTGNTNATPIAPGGGIVVSGGCTVINSAGASVSIAGGTYTKINNDGTTE